MRRAILVLSVLALASCHDELARTFNAPDSIRLKDGRECAIKEIGFMKTDGVPNLEVTYVPPPGTPLDSQVLDPIAQELVSQLVAGRDIRGARWIDATYEYEEHSLEAPPGETRKESHGMYTHLVPGPGGTWAVDHKR